MTETAEKEVKRIEKYYNTVSEKLHIRVPKRSQL